MSELQRVELISVVGAAGARVFLSWLCETTEVETPVLSLSVWGSTESSVPSALWPPLLGPLLIGPKNLLFTKVFGWETAGVRIEHRDWVGALKNVPSNLPVLELALMIYYQQMFVYPF